jgi:hypothetical protein
MMKKLTSEQLLPPKRARNEKARLVRAELAVVAARKRAAETAQRYAAVWQTRRLAERLSAKS